MFAVEAGEGQPFVLIHGALCTHVDWLDAPFSGFAARGRAIAVDRPGHGDSARPRFAASPFAQARQLRDGLAALDVVRPILVGHSFGGLVALAYAASFPDEIAGLLLLAPIAVPELRPAEHLLFAPRAAPICGPLLSEAMRIADPALLKTLHRAMFAPQPVPPDWEARYPHEVILSRRQMVEEGEDAAAVLPPALDAWVDFERITCPVEIVTGDPDPIADPNKHAKPLARRLTRANLVRLPGIGHMLHHCALEEVLHAADRLLAP